MRPNIVGRTYVAYETEEGELLVIRYSIRYNRYYAYRCQYSGTNVAWNTCKRINLFFVCHSLRVAYCVHSSPSENVYLEAKVCLPVFEADLNRMLSGCPRRNYIRVPWDRLRRRTRREVLRECRGWWRTHGVEDVDDYLDGLADNARDMVYDWVNQCFTMAEPFIDLLFDYLDEANSIRFDDETMLRWCRCAPGGFIIRDTCTTSRGVYTCA